MNKIQNRNWRCRFTSYKHVKFEELFFDTFSHSISDKNVCFKSENDFILIFFYIFAFETRSASNLLNSTAFNDFHLNVHVPQSIEKYGKIEKMSNLLILSETQ